MAADSYPVFAPMRPCLDYHNLIAANKSNAKFGTAHHNRCSRFIPYPQPPARGETAVRLAACLPLLA
ncbi:MAG: hypothetical protein ACO1RT_19225 [Planctomycetaceae bacterium]